MSEKRAPLDWYIEVCIECGCQLGPGIGSRTPSGRCVNVSHHDRGGTVVRVVPRPPREQEDISAERIVARLSGEVGS